MILLYFFLKPWIIAVSIWFLILLPLCVTLCKLFLYLLGDWLEAYRCPEWADVITNAKVQTTGSSEAILSAAHVKKTRYVPQVNVAVLYPMLTESFDDSGDRDFHDYTQKNVIKFRILVNIARARMSYADVCA